MLCSDFTEVHDETFFVAVVKEVFGQRGDVELRCLAVSRVIPVLYVLHVANAFRR